MAISRGSAWFKYRSSFVHQLGSFSEGQSAHYPRDSPLGRSGQHCVAGLTVHPLSPAVPFLCHFPAFLLIFPRITSPVNSAHFEFCLRVCFWAHPNLIRSGLSICRISPLSRSNKVKRRKHRAHSRWSQHQLLLLSSPACSFQRRDD